MNAYYGDVHKFTTYDGIDFIIPRGNQINMVAYGGYGAPPTDFITRRGYKQDGFTELGFQLNQRSISVTIHANKDFCDRASYWEFRKELNDFLRPNRGGPLTMTVISSDGTQRALKVRANPGFVFPPISPDQNDWAIDETLEFIAFDPIWYNPNENLDALTGSYGTDLVFPVTFDASHIIFGPSGLKFSKVITYPGTWKVYPKFIIDGPYDTAIIQNETTGLTIYMNIPIALGEQRIIDLTPGNQSITDASGVNKFGELGPDSNLVDFCIEPDPIVPGGIQTVSVILIGSHGSAYYNEVQADYPARYYRYNEKTGTIIYDSGYEGQVGTASNVVLNQPGALAGDTDTSARFVTASPSFVQFPSINLSNRSYTVEYWFKWNTGAPLQNAIFELYDVTEEFLLNAYDLGGGTNCFTAYINPPGISIVSPNLYSEMIWYHVVFTYDVVSNIGTFYVNGQPVVSGAFSPYTIVAPSVYVGATLGIFIPADGWIDDMAVYYKVLSADRVLAHYNASPRAFSSGAELDYFDKYFAI